MIARIVHWYRSRRDRRAYRSIEEQERLFRLAYTDREAFNKSVCRSWRKRVPLRRVRR